MTVGFSVYWASNLILWFPWSISPKIGMVLMLTVGTGLWAFATYSCLIRYPKTALLKGALLTGLILLISAILMDYVFFGLIRNAMTELYHPTTFYGYAFVAILPFIYVFAFQKIIEKNKKKLNRANFVKAGTLGLLCFTLLALIIILRVGI